MDGRELLSWNLWQFGARTAHQLGKLGPHNIHVKQQLRELLNHVVLVIDVAIEHRVTAGYKVLQLVVWRNLRFFTKLEGRHKIANVTSKWTGLGYEGRIVELEPTERLTCFDKGTSWLDKTDNTCLGGWQRKQHLHHLHLGIGIATPNMTVVLDKVARELPTIWRLQNTRVLLLLEQKRLTGNHHSDLVARLQLILDLVGDLTI
mmetsp:Transcript_38233/g.63212  ORF Transcript_38233/g.63212 Transcript_38233/m.63212 type:complete len:204 (+) Transcript_38233:4598-5209(+)